MIRSVLLALFFIPLSFAQKAPEKPLVVAVVDTGYSPLKTGIKARLCKYGHADFTGVIPVYNKVPKDENGHGSKITHIINDELVAKGLTNFCIVVIKYIKDRNVDFKESAINSVRYLNNLKSVNVINYSSTGDWHNKKEKMFIELLLDRGVDIFAAAGNEGVSFDENEVYPAQYDNRIHVVGFKNSIYNFLKTQDGKEYFHYKSNFGSGITNYESPTYTINGDTEVGTSISTAIATRKFVERKLLSK